MVRTLRLPLLLATLALPLALAACNTGTQPGDTNVEHDSPKERTDNHPGTSNADSVAAGMQPDTAKITGKQLYNEAAGATDSNHDGKAD